MGVGKQSTQAGIGAGELAQRSDAVSGRHQARDGHAGSRRRRGELLTTCRERQQHERLSPCRR
eukprot:3290218-Lingulodinium_polyedra.AAC.1